MTQKERDGYFSKVLLYLYERPNEKFSYAKLVEVLKIPSEYKDAVWKKLWHSSPRPIDGKSVKQDAEIWINKNGIAHVDELESLYFETTGLPIFATFVEMSLPETCEAIFQKHKQAPGCSIQWAKGVFNPTPRNLPEAKEIMLSNKILFPSSITPKKTILNEAVHEANSYVKAKEILKNKDTPASTIKVGGDFTGQLFSQSSVNDLIIDRIERTKTTNPFAPRIKSRTSRVIKFIFEAIATLAGLIAIYEFILKHILKTPSLF